MKKYLVRHRFVLILFSLVIVLGFAAAVWLSLSSFQPQVGKPFTVSGTAACLPHRVDGDVRTLECALGFKTDEGKYFALRDDSGTLTAKLIFGEHQTVSGILRKYDDSKYAAEGRIDLTEVK